LPGKRGKGRIRRQGKFLEHRACRSAEKLLKPLEEGHRLFLFKDKLLRVVFF